MLRVSVVGCPDRAEGGEAICTCPVRDRRARSAGTRQIPPLRRAWVGCTIAAANRKLGQPIQKHTWGGGHAERNGRRPPCAPHGVASKSLQAGGRCRGRILGNDTGGRERGGRGAADARRSSS